ncbi:MAG: hypothetical protein IT353_01370 [Gemmatimonadaceae bacterium]|nr:hypothetical protein [Gemmatimonadaceae bacterium]
MHSADFVRTQTPIAADPAWAGVRHAGGLVVPSDAKAPQGASPLAGSDAESSTDLPRRGWWRLALRMVRNAAVGLSILAAVPFTVIGVWGDDIFRSSAPGMSRVVEVERLRPAALAHDAALTPLDAGRLLHTLHPTAAVKGLPTHPVSVAIGRPWDTKGADSGLFASLRTTGAEGAVASNIVTAAPRGFSTQEMAYLEAVATAPYWEDLERVVRAPAVDIIGGRFVVPFHEDARAYAMPITKFADSKRVAYAGVSRAAYYVATGDFAKAEHALKTVVSYGFVLIDNGPFIIDALIGRVIVNIGRDGLQQLYTLTGNIEGQRLTAPFSAQPSAPIRGGLERVVSTAELISDVKNTTLPHTQRLESLHQLSYASCSSIRGVFAGPSADIRGTFVDARTTLARFPAEQAYIDLMQRPVEQLAIESYSKSVPARVIDAAATATSAVLGNQRVATCAKIVLLNRGSN